MRREGEKWEVGRRKRREERRGEERKGYLLKTEGTSIKINMTYSCHEESDI
jgi:hypothetical protein